jgi:anti-sigma B factor antagonist/stage II sporulation protein AA (anti-sigma F factor antagonist)
MTMLARIVEERRGDFAVARIHGEIDASNVGWLEARLSRLLDNQAHGLVIDLADTTYLDSAGIALIFGLASSLRRHQQELRLVLIETSPIARMVSLTGLSASVPTYESIEAAAGG